MRHNFLWIGLLCLAALSGCGNGNDGRPFSPIRKPSSALEATSNTQSILAPVTKLLFCSNPRFASANDEFNALFAGSVLCPSEGVLPSNRGFNVRLKVNGGIPANTRLCIVPFVGSIAEVESCFSINGQADVLLATNQYTSAIVLAESNLSAYKAYLNNLAPFAPPRILFHL